MAIVIVSDTTIVKNITYSNTVVKAVTVGPPVTTPQRVVDEINVNLANISEDDILRYDSATSNFLPESLDSALTSSRSHIRGMFNVGGDLSYDSATGKFSIDVEVVYTKANFDSDFNVSIDSAALGGKGLTYNASSNTLSIDSAELYAQYKHDDFADFVTNEHIDHSSVTLTAGKGLSGGGDITTNRSFAIDSAEFLAGFEASIDHDNLTGFVADEHVAHTSVTLTAGKGLSGGGDISSSRSFAIDSAEFLAGFEASIDHDNLTGFVANEHIDHTSVTLTAGKGLSGGGDISSNRNFAIDSAEFLAGFEASINHDNLTGFVANEHVDHSGVTLTAGKGLSGGGDITTNRSFAIDSAEFLASFEASINHDNLAGFVANEHIDHTSVTLTAGKGLSGGGDISTNRSFAIDSAEFLAGFEASINHDNLTGFVANEHIDHSGVTLTAGKGLSGGGDIATGRSFAIDSAELYAQYKHDDFADFVANEHIDHTSVTLTAGKGLSGGGDISSSRSFAIDSAEFLAGFEASINHDNLTGFVANEHTDHTSVTLTAGKGLSGGGDISSSRSFAIDSAEFLAGFEASITHDNLAGFVADEHVAHSGVTLTAGKGLSGGGDISTNRSFAIDSAEFLAGFEASINHDNLSGFVADEHVAHTSITLTAGKGLSGGGDISSSRSFAIDSAEFLAGFEASITHDNLTGFVANEHIDHTSVTLTAGKGLSGGGDISTNRSFAIDSAEFLAGFEASITHDNLAGFVANEHIDWTSASSAFSTTGTAATGDLTVTGKTTTDSAHVTLLIEIDSGTAPSVTTDKLYNVAGALYWNNIRLDSDAKGGGGGGGTTISSSPQPPAAPDSDGLWISTKDATLNWYYYDSDNTGQWVVLSGPAGPQGPTGATGATGATGPTGPSGPALTSIDSAADVTLTNPADNDLLVFDSATQLWKNENIEASVAEYRSKTANKYVTSQIAFNAMAPVSLLDSAGGIINVDLATGFNFKVTLSGSNAATFNFLNVVAGQTGRLRINYSDSSNTGTFQLSGGTVLNAPTLSTDSAALDIVYYDCLDSNEIYLNANTGVT